MVDSQMSQHKAIICWKRNNSEFLKGKYSREHEWRFDGGATVPAAASPSNVPGPYTNAACVDPEEAFVAAISSCHMLWFLFLASKQGFQVDSYEDEATGILTQSDKGVPWVSSVMLDPEVIYSGERQPTLTDEQRLHHEAHKQCFIANSVKTQVALRGRDSTWTKA